MGQYLHVNRKKLKYLCVCKQWLSVFYIFSLHGFQCKHLNSQQLCCEEFDCLNVLMGQRKLSTFANKNIIFRSSLFHHGDHFVVISPNETAQNTKTYLFNCIFLDLCKMLCHVVLKSN